jgi:hypothetical protein
MFQDQLSRNSMNRCSWYIGWEKFVLFSSLILGIALAAAAQQLAIIDEVESDWHIRMEITNNELSPVNVQVDDTMRDIAIFMLAIVGKCATKKAQTPSLIINSRMYELIFVHALGCICDFPFRCAFDWDILNISIT